MRMHCMGRMGFGATLQVPPPAHLADDLPFVQEVLDGVLADRGLTGA